MKMAQYGAVIFDAGNTLIVHRPSYGDLFLQFLLSKGIETGRDDAEKAWQNARDWAENLTHRELMGERRMPHEDFIVNYCKTALGSLGRQWRKQGLDAAAADFIAFADGEQRWIAIEGVHGILDAIRARRVRLGLVSNFDVSLPDILKKESLYRYFDSIVVSALAGIEKPDPRIMQISCSELSVDPSDALYVGDHPFDVLCAKEAGMDVAWVCGEAEELPPGVGHVPDYKIPAVTQLPAALGWVGAFG